MAKLKFLSFDGVRTLVQWAKDQLATKVDKVAGKDLSDNNYSDDDVAKLESIENGAQSNIIESISVNNVAQVIDDKNVNIAIPLVDDTLTNTGQSADAKATGDAIAEVNQSLSQTATAIRQEFDDADSQLIQEMTQTLEDLSATIPTKTSQLTNNSDYTTKQYVDGELDTLEASIPTKVSQLQNDSSYATITQLSDGLATKEDTLQYDAATAEDVGKAMMPKTVADGKVTSWEFGEAGKVDDVQINGTSILENKVANIPIATDSNPGVVKVNSAYGVQLYNNILAISPASTERLKGGADMVAPVTAVNQHASTFYGLARAAGDTTQSSSSNAVGTYTDSAKTAIQLMLGIDTAIADAVGDITSFEFQVVTELPITGTKGIIYLRAHSHGDNDAYDEYIWVTDRYERLGTLDIDLSSYATIQYVDSELDKKVEDVQISGTSVVTDGVANVPIASGSDFGVVKVSSSYGLQIYGSGVNRNIGVIKASDASIKSASTVYSSITPDRQHISAFYGLAKAAGDTTQSASANAVGTYTNEAKTAIKNMLGFATSSDISDAIDNLVNTRYHVCEPGEYNSTTYIPTLTGELGVIYLVPKPIGDTGIDNDSITGTAQVGTATIATTNNIFYEYIYTGDKFEQIGDTKVDLTGYLTDADIATDASVTTMLNQVFS